MNVKISPEKYLKYLYLPNLFGVTRTKEILQVNPTVSAERKDAPKVFVSVYDYDTDEVIEKRMNTVVEATKFKETNRISWINIDGIRKADIELICTHFGIHPPDHGRYPEHGPATQDG